MVALITPFKNGKVDNEALERMVEFHIKNGTTCLVVTGTTGECPTLTFEEHLLQSRLYVMQQKAVF